MSDAEILAEAIRRTGHLRYAELVDPTHPDYQPAYWPLIRKAAGVADAEVNPPTPYPPLLEQAGNAARSLIAAAASGFAVVGDEEHRRRLDICEACPEYDAAQNRCRKCGCFNSLKAKLESQKCPLEKW